LAFDIGRPQTRNRKIMQRVVLITGNELRHEFFRKYLGLDGRFAVQRSYCEQTEHTLEKVVMQDNTVTLRKQHLAMRLQSERDFFSLYCSGVEDRSSPEVLPYGTVSGAERVTEILDLQPDLIVCYGCSIIRPTLIHAFRGRILNVHLGLSPYYRGAGTNFWPFVNGEPEYAGVTFLQLDEGIDTGAIIHQIQADIFDGDSVHQIGNRLIAKMAATCCGLISNFTGAALAEHPPVGIATGRVYRKKDFTEAAVARLYQNFREGMIERYLEESVNGMRMVQLVKDEALIRKSTIDESNHVSLRP
jgi:phosphoribosylglycinamide formyltransferase 1